MDLEKYPCFQEFLIPICKSSFSSVISGRRTTSSYIRSIPWCASRSCWRGNSLCRSLVAKSGEIRCQVRRKKLLGFCSMWSHMLIQPVSLSHFALIRTKPRNISTTTSSKDMQMISLTLRVLHRPDREKLSQIYQRLGMDYDDRVLPSIGNEVLKSTIAQFNPEELITQRAIVSNYYQFLLNRLTKHHVCLHLFCTPF